MNGEGTIRQIFSAADIRCGVERVAREVLEHFGTEDEVLVAAVLNGGLWFAADLLRLLPANYRLDTIRVSSYGAGRESSGTLKWLSPMPQVAGRRVLVVDDLADSGMTLRKIRQAVVDLSAAEVLCAVAVNKGERRSCAFTPDFAALHTGPGYLVGYGMDAAGKYRNLPFIGVLED